MHIIGWLDGDNLFWLVEKLRIIKYWYERKMMDGMFRLNLNQTIIMMYKSVKKDTKKTH